MPHPIRYKDFSLDVIENHKIFNPITLSREGITFKPTPQATERDYSTRGENFNLVRFNEIHLPTVIAEVQNKTAFSESSALAILDCPILMPGFDGEYRVPKELERFLPIIENIAKHESALNPHHNNRYAYVTVDQRPVKENNTQRTPGLHVDGFQGHRIIEEFGDHIPIDTQYVVYDSLPTVFYNQPFPVNALSLSRHNYFLAFEMLVDENNAQRTDPYQILSFNAYAVHRADTSPIDQERTFFRLSYSERPFDRWGNTKNPMFDYNWDMVTRDVAPTLKEPTWEELNESCLAINWAPSKQLILPDLYGR